MLRLKPRNYGIQEVAQINRLIRQGWLDYEIRPSVAASDGEWVRRVYLDILGRIPSVEELREFTQERSPEKRKALVTKLLYDEEYTEQYANNWTTIWTNVLIGQSGGTERNSLTSRPGMQKYLRDSLLATSTITKWFTNWLQRLAQTHRN